MILPAVKNRRRRTPTATNSDGVCPEGILGLGLVESSALTIMNMDWSVVLDVKEDQGMYEPTKIMRIIRNDIVASD